MRFFSHSKKALTMCLIAFLIISIFCIEAEAKFINTFLYRIGGSALRSGDESHLAKHSIIFVQKYHYDDIRGDTWGAIKKINQNAKIYTYASTMLVNTQDDSVSPVFLNNLGRYNVSRGHSMGSLNGNHKEFFLLNSNGQRVRWKWNNKPVYWLDFGNSNFHKYSIESTAKDHDNQPWSADGVYSDNNVLTMQNVETTPVKFNTIEKWIAGMQRHMLALSSGMHSRGFEFAGNAGPTYKAEGFDAWMNMDMSVNHPDVLVEEAAFAVSFGTGDIQFYGESKWKYQLDLLGSLKNINACLMSSVEVAPGQNGVDNFGKSFNFYDALWYSLGSYLVGKNDSKNNSFFQFYHSQAHYNTADVYYDEYGIDLGKAVDDYQVTAYNKNNIYWREFDKGYVFVNPTTSDVSSIRLPETCKQFTHSNINTAPEALPDITSINLKSHRAAILYKKIPS